MRYECYVKISDSAEVSAPDDETAMDKALDELANDLLIRLRDYGMTRRTIKKYLDERVLSINCEEID